MIHPPPTHPSPSDAIDTVDFGDLDRNTPLYPIENDEIKSCQDAFRNFKKIFEENESNEQNTYNNNDGLNNNISAKTKLFQSDKVRTDLCAQSVEISGGQSGGVRDTIETTIIYRYINFNPGRFFLLCLLPSDEFVLFRAK